MIDVIKMTINHLLQIFLHQLQDLDRLDDLMMMMIFLAFHLHNLLLVILLHLIYHQLQILHHSLNIANQILRMMMVMMISILIFLKKNLTPTQKFSLSSRNIKKMCELEMAREEKPKVKKG